MAKRWRNIETLDLQGTRLFCVTVVLTLEALYCDLVRCLILLVYGKIRVANIIYFSEIIELAAEEK